MRHSFIVDLNVDALPATAVDPDSDWRRVRGILATNDVIAAYDGRIGLSDDAVRDIAESLNSGAVPFSANHDSSRPLRARAFHSWVEEQDGGRLIVQFECEMHRDDIHVLEEMHGMSFTTLDHIVSGQTGSDSTGSDLLISGDAAWFNDADIVLAAGVMLGRGIDAPQLRVDAARIYQFAIIPDPRIIVQVSEYVWQTVGTGIAASIIWDGIKVLWARRRTRRDRENPPSTSIELRLQAVNGARLDAVIKSDNEQEIRQAMNCLPAVIGALNDLAAGERSVRIWTDTDGSSVTEMRWRPP
jgi:hypothetical protein